MNEKLTGTLLGVAGLLLWFMPLRTVEFMGQTGWQAGYHLQGIAYLVPAACVAYAILSWMEQHVPRIIAAGLAVAVAGLIAADSGSSMAWGLVGLLLVSTAGVALAVKDMGASKAKAA